jgi:hypothetical protein
MNGALIIGGDDENVPVTGTASNARGFLMKVLPNGAIDTEALKLNTAQLSAARGSFHHAHPGYFRTKDDVFNIRDFISTGYCSLPVLLHDYRFAACLPMGDVEKRNEPVVGSNFLKSYLTDFTSSSTEETASSAEPPIEEEDLH